MANIDKTVKSKYPPKQKNVNWIDTSGDKPEMKTFFNGKWSSVGGSGADSTNPTEADVNKVWQVTPVQKGTKIEETVIVPEQTLVDMQELEYNDKFVPGVQCVAVINGVEYRGEVENLGLIYSFAEGDCSFGYDTETEIFQFWNNTEFNEVTAKLSVIEEVPDYDYNWASGVKIPIPTAEDEGKILVVTKVDGNNTSIIVPEQPVPADTNTPLTGVDLTKFVVGNTVKVTIIPEETPEENDNDTPVPGHLPDYSGPVDESGQGGSSETLIPEPKIPEPTTSQTVTITGVIEEHEEVVGVPFNINDNTFAIWQEDNSLYTSASDVGPNLTIKLECIESNYEYQLQENNDDGYTVTKSYQPYLDEQDIETMLDENYAYSNEYQIDAPLVEGNTYKVTFEGVEYELVCSAYEGGANLYLGAAYNIDLSNYDFSTYPFNFLTYFYNGEYLYSLSTPEAGTYSLKIDEIIEEVTTTPEFEAAVKSVIESMS